MFDLLDDMFGMDGEGIENAAEDAIEYEIFKDVTGEDDDNV